MRDILPILNLCLVLIYKFYLVCHHIFSVILFIWQLRNLLQSSIFVAICHLSLWSDKRAQDGFYQYFLAHPGIGESKF